MLPQSEVEQAAVHRVPRISLDILALCYPLELRSLGALVSLVRIMM
jgi:hypothetical protein